MTCPFKVGDRIKYQGTLEVGKAASLAPSWRPGDAGKVVEVVSDDTIVVKFDLLRGAKTRLYLTSADGSRYDIVEAEVVAPTTATPASSGTNGGPQT